MIIFLVFPRTWTFCISFEFCCWVSLLVKKCFFSSLCLRHSIRNTKCIHCCSLYRKWWGKTLPSKRSNNNNGKKFCFIINFVWVMLKSSYFDTLTQHAKQKLPNNFFTHIKWKNNIILMLLPHTVFFIAPLVSRFRFKENIYSALYFRTSSTLFVFFA